jgi:hypothetical protein
VWAELFQLVLEEGVLVVLDGLLVEDQHV